MRSSRAGGMRTRIASRSCATMGSVLRRRGRSGAVTYGPVAAVNAPPLPPRPKGHGLATPPAGKAGPPRPTGRGRGGPVARGGGATGRTFPPPTSLPATSRCRRGFQRSPGRLRRRRHRHRRRGRRHGPVTARGMAGRRRHQQHHEPHHRHQHGPRQRSRQITHDFPLLPCLRLPGGRYPARSSRAISFRAPRHDPDVCAIVVTYTPFGAYTFQWPDPAMATVNPWRRRSRMSRFRSDPPAVTGPPGPPGRPWPR